MAHHSTHSEVSAEPNLVPLLDLVLQLIMFFMMCANFVMEENDQTIKLPISQMAKPLPEIGPDVLHLSIDDDGAVRVVGRKSMTRDDEVQVFLREVVDSSKRRMAQRSETGEVKTLVIIRASRDCSFYKIYAVMRRCQEAGLRRLQLRAERS
jgi:biopolymer transport protein ExbD